MFNQLSLMIDLRLLGWMILLPLHQSEVDKYTSESRVIWSPDSFR